MQIFFDGCDLCGYGVSFDLAFLELEFKRADINYSKAGREVEITVQLIA